jgi:hypothetical protein
MMTFYVLLFLFFLILPVHQASGPKAYCGSCLALPFLSGSSAASFSLKSSPSFVWEFSFHS